MHILYSAGLAVALLLTLPYWLLQMLRHGKYRSGLAERLGSIPPRLHRSTAKSIWVHAVSVGEVLASTALIRGLIARFPDHRIVVSTTTATGQKLARDRFGPENVFYFPLDFQFALRPYLDLLQPQLIVVAETELWPNFFALAHDRGIPIAVVNARISGRSFPRYSRISRWLRPTLEKVALFLAQSATDAERLLAIGAPAERVHMSGNLKFDIAAGADSPLVAQLRPALGHPVIVAGSTVEGEEPLVLAAFAAVQRQYPSATLLLAPRHPERFDAVAALLRRQNYWRRSQWSGGSVAGGVFLLDTIGELAAVYQLAELAFVGGSLVPRGGHNILEAARFGVPVVVGPHTENFRDMIDLFRSANALRVADAAGLSATLLSLLADEPGRAALGQRARDIWRINTGATERTLARLQSLLPEPVAVPEGQGRR